MREIEGKRIYGAWAGNPKGTPENTTQCIEEVMEKGRGIGFYQCTKKRGHGEGGLYCKVHDPEYIKAKRKAEQDKLAKESAENNARYELQYTAVNACKAINPDNPQAVAESIGDMFKALVVAYEHSIDRTELDLEGQTLLADAIAKAGSKPCK